MTVLHHPGPGHDDVAAAAAGDPHAVSRVIAGIRPVVVRYCRSKLGRRASVAVTAEDIAQEVCLAVMVALPRYEDRGRPFMAFVYRIASNIVSDALRPRHHRDGTGSEQAEHLLSLPDTAPGPEYSALGGDLTAELRTLLSLISPRGREILVLRLAFGFSTHDVAERLGTTAGAIRVAQHRALSQLRQAVDLRYRVMSDPPWSEVFTLHQASYRGVGRRESGPRLGRRCGPSRPVGR